ncbi:heme-binding protein [Pseudomonas sp. CrR25]|nr:heme-binding protein [Pseudomonas sp. CrR25]
MNALNLTTATAISSRALAVGREISAAPLTVAVLDAGGHLISLQREDGASLLRPQIAIGKAWGAVALGKGSRLIAADAQQRPAFIGAVNNLADGNLVPAPGGVLIRNQQGEVIGAIGITGDTSDIDEQCAISAVESVGLKADAGVAG